MTMHPTLLHWISVDERLPPIDQAVLVAHKSGYDGKPILAFGARLDGDEGWCWGVGGQYGIRLDNDSANDIHADDEYVVTHWAPLNDPGGVHGENEDRNG